MPFYEYKCDDCLLTTTELRPVSECREPLVTDCIVGQTCKKVCTLKRILSPTPTNFRFNDRTGFKGLDKKRG